MVLVRGWTKIIFTNVVNYYTYKHILVLKYLILTKNEAFCRFYLHINKKSIIKLNNNYFRNYK